MWPGFYGWMTQSHMVVPARGVNQSQGARESLPPPHHPLELPLVNVRLWGWPGFILMCVIIQCRHWKEVRQSCPSGLMRPEHDQSDDYLIQRVWSKRKGQWSIFMAPAVEWKVPSGVVTRVQKTRIQQQKDNCRWCQLQRSNQPSGTACCLGSALLCSCQSQSLAFLSFLWGRTIIPHSCSH